MLVVVRYSLMLVFLCCVLGENAEASRRRASRVPANTIGQVEGQWCRNGDRNRFRCMVCNVFFESRGEPYAGKLDVARTVLTRMAREDRGACRVIYRRYQFSWTLERPERLPTRRSTPAEYEALRESVRAVNEARARGANGITHFYSPSAMARRKVPKWARSPKCRFVRQVGGHKFFNCSANIDEEMRETAMASAERGALPPEWEYYATSGSFDPMVQAANASPLTLIREGTDEPYGEDRDTGEEADDDESIDPSGHDLSPSYPQQDSTVEPTLLPHNPAI